METKNKYIYYTGIGANNGFIHAIDEFINIILEVNELIYNKYKVKNFTK